MSRRRKLLIVGGMGAAILAGLLVSAVLAVRLLANRDLVKAFIATKTAQATGGTLDIGRLTVGFLPLPHIRARNVRLQMTGRWTIQAQELSVYARLLPILKGDLDIRRLAVIAPEIEIAAVADDIRQPDGQADRNSPTLDEDWRQALGGLFGGLAAIEPETQVRIDDGTLTLARAGRPVLRIAGIEARAANHEGRLWLNLTCRPDFSGDLTLRMEVDPRGMQADGRLQVADVDLAALLTHVPLPGEVAVMGRRASVEATVGIQAPANLTSRFTVHCPTLTVQRGNRRLDLETAALHGRVDYADRRLSVSVDRLQSVEPPVDLAGHAAFTPPDAQGRSRIELTAAAKQLDIATAARVAGAVAGDLKAIRTAFDVAREGVLTDVSYRVAFDGDQSGWRMTGMQAAGHLARGRVSIPGIGTDLVDLETDVIYADHRVTFKQVRGRLAGATVEGLQAAIDWEKQPTLSIEGSSVTMDVAPFYKWITGFDDLKKVRDLFTSESGIARVTRLRISGPLTEPGRWFFEIYGTPQDVQINSPLLPFPVRVSGGEIVYLPGEARATDVTVDFLDGTFRASLQSAGLITFTSSAVYRIDGSMGEAVLAWLHSLHPIAIPDELQIKPPVELSGVTIALSEGPSIAVRGGLKSAGGVTLFTDGTWSPGVWQINELRFDDGHSRVTASVRMQDATVDLTFAGNIEKPTADRLLTDNQTLAGAINGDFKARIDTRHPLRSSFDGRLSGHGLHIRQLIDDPITVDRFSVDGRGDQLTIDSAAVTLLDSRMTVNGELHRTGGELAIDLHLEADRVDEKLIHALQPGGKQEAPPPPVERQMDAPIVKGVVHLSTPEFTYGGFTWSPLEADLRLDGDRVDVRIDQADLCGIGTTGTLAVSAQGVGLSITPTASGASLQETVDCLWQRPISADARYDLSGAVQMAPTNAEPWRSLSGRMEFSSENGIIRYHSTLMKIMSVLNITEVFTGGKSDLAENGYGYSRARATAAIGDGTLRLEEILVDGNSLKLTGQGSIDLQARTADITLLAAPLKTVDRIVNNIPVINYITGGSLVSVPLRVYGPLDNPTVATMAPSAVGKGLLDLMQRTVKAPFKLVENVEARATGSGAAQSSGTVSPRQPSP